MDRERLMRSVLHELFHQKRISPNLLHFPDDVLLCAQEYSKRYLREVMDEMKAESVPFDVVGDKVIAEIQEHKTEE